MSRRLKTACRQFERGLRHFNDGAVGHACHKPESWVKRSMRHVRRRAREIAR